MSATRTEQVGTADGGRLDAHLALPPSGSGPGVVVLQEIFGVNDYITQAAGRLAAAGYVALAPDLYWRIEPGLALGHGKEDLTRAMAIVQRLDRRAAVSDAVDTLSHLRGLSEVTGGAGVLGFCLGGRLAYEVAAEDEPDAAVCYYGSGIADALERADRITCPTLFHFGGQDQYIPREQVDRVAAMAAARDHMEFHVQEDAGHAFDNHESAMFHNAPAAARAWEITREFLARTLSPTSV